MIREALECDYDDIVFLGSLLHSNYLVVNNFYESFNDDVNNYLVYVIDDKVVGFLSYVKVGNSIDIMDLVVDIFYRKQGIASNLLDYLFSSLVYDSHVFLEVDTLNDEAMSLYLKFGFKIINKRDNYYGDRDCYVMERVIG